MLKHQILPIYTAEDERIAAYRDIRERRFERDRRFFIAEGENVVLRLVASQHPVDSILIAENRLERLLPLLSRPMICYTVPEPLLQQIAGFKFHRGILGCGIRTSLPGIQNILKDHRNDCRVVIVAGIMDPENLGTILRTCSAFAVHAVLLGDRTLDPFLRRVVRVSMGTLFTLPLASTDDLGKDLTWLREVMNLDLYATVLDSRAKSLSQITPSGRWGLILGNESSGVAPQWLEQCDEWITIPMANKIDSINVAVAAGIFIYSLSYRKARPSGCLKTHLQKLLSAF